MAIEPSGLSATASTSALPSQQDTKPKHAHLTNLSASLAIKQLDRLAFPSAASLQSDISDIKAKKQRLRVVDVEKREAGPKPPSRRFGALSQDLLYRERARQRRQERAQTRSLLLESRKGKERASDAWLQLDDVASGADANKRSTYQPFSLPALLDRLTTFTISTYSNKPDAHRLLSPLGMAMHGWHHKKTQARDEVACVTCAATLSTRIAAGVSRVEAAEACATLEEQILAAHRPTCPWRLKSCAPSLYRVPISSRAGTQAELSAASLAFARCQGIEGLQLDLPQALPSGLDDVQDETSRQARSLALFGWRSADIATDVKDCIAACQYCSRKAGLWAFVQDATPSRHFDVVREHKSYCPMVNGEVQSGMWLRAYNDRDSAKVQQQSSGLPAWKILATILQLDRDPSLSAGVRKDDGNMLGTDVRSMKSADVLASIRSLVG